MDGQILKINYRAEMKNHGSPTRKFCNKIISIIWYEYVSNISQAWV